MLRIRKVILCFLVIPFFSPILTIKQTLINIVNFMKKWTRACDAACVKWRGRGVKMPLYVYGHLIIILETECYDKEIEIQFANNRNTF